MSLLNKAGAYIIPQKWAHHLMMFWRYWTFLKLFNLAKTVLFYAIGKRNISSYPPFLKIETTNRCNMGCKYCYMGKSNQNFDFDDYTCLVDQLSPYAFEVSLHDIGEPLLHKRILEYVDYAHKKRVGTIMSTSLSVKKPDEFWLELIESGIDHLVVAIDGITPETYNKYRVNGDLPLIFENLRKLVTIRNERNAKLYITWQMISFPWNEHEHEGAEKLAEEFGCDNFKLIFDEYMPRRQYYKEPIERTRQCLMPFLMFIVRADGKVRPCCNIYKGISDDLHHENLVGDVKQQDFVEIWNSEALSNSRNKNTICSSDYCKHCREM